MRYRVTCLTPTLAGDGERLSPIDYMVWKDQVNVLDQQRIFRLLARGPRLEGYLTQLKKAEKLDFASWGGFAQNYAGRRIPFEHAGAAAAWERARPENLFIPTFATGPRGAYLPASALKGAFRTAVVSARANQQVLKDAASRVSAEGRGIRQVANAVEDAALGPGGSNAMRLLSLADSEPVAATAFKVYLLRVSTLATTTQSRFEVAWKQAPRGSSKRVEDGTPTFAEMAAPGSVFEGEWRENSFLSQPGIAKALRAGNRPTVAAMLQAANSHTAELLELHRSYAVTSGLQTLAANIKALRDRSDAIAGSGDRCLLPLGWGGGLLSKAAFLNTSEGPYRQLLGQMPYYSRAVQSPLPFPKTRRIVFLENQPATLPGFVELALT